MVVTIDGVVYWTRRELLPKNAKVKLPEPDLLAVVEAGGRWVVWPGDRRKPVALYQPTREDVLSIAAVREHREHTAPLKYEPYVSRPDLQKRNGLRERFYGTFERTGKASRYDRETVLLLNVKDADGKLVTDHLWFNLTGEFLYLIKQGLSTGDVVGFNARVKGYVKGRERLGFDYKLSYPTQVEIVEKNAGEVALPPDTKT